jgi:signal transduction histidine kinase
MKTKPTDNLTSRIEDILLSARSSQGDETIRVSTAEIRELINSEKLEAAGRLAAWLSHKINNPLGTISGNAQLLARRLDRDVGDSDSMETYTRYIDSIRSQIERCAQITNELLDFTRPRDVEIRKLDVLEAAQEAVELARYGRSAALTISLDEKLPPVLADKELVVRVLYEVVTNAMNAAGEDGSIDISGDVIAGTEWVRLIVSDDGAGIPKDVLPRIFEPFFSTREKSRGLGLTRSLAFMHQLGGTIDVVKTDSEGTKMAIQLPVGGQR